MVIGGRTETQIVTVIAHAAPYAAAINRHSCFLASGISASIAHTINRTSQPSLRSDAKPTPANSVNNVKALLCICLTHKSKKTS